MVKNFGGNKSKKFGRKHLVDNTANRKLRLKEDTDEVYACVSKMLGNGMCNVIGIDNCARLCIIRNKFRGRSKRHNMIAPWSWVLVGDRSWETSASKETKSAVNKCDLLEVYSEQEKERLQDEVDEKWGLFRHIGQMTSQTGTVSSDAMGEVGNESGDDDEFGLGFDFAKSNAVDEEVTNKMKSSLLNESNNGKNGSGTSHDTFIVGGDEINIDDI